jgi:mannose/cellobiose epimerase-like protein (N-acyl-D-glucosamine 2-epimerase family)
MSLPGDRDYLATERLRLLEFAKASRHPAGFGWLDDRGVVDPARPVELWITCRMTHVFALGVLLGYGGTADLAEHGVRALAGPLRDAEHDGWFPAATDEGPVVTTKAAYGHAFVVLAASSAVAAGIPGAPQLLAAALEVSERRFWDEDAGLVVEEWTRDWSRLEDYRGVNANMHTVEAYLAAGDLTGDGRWHARAGRIAARVVAWAAGNSWRIPEHFDAGWQPRLDYNIDQPADPFRPYGATVGAAAPAGLVPAAVALTERAVADGWAVDGADGFVYTTGWDGTPVTRQRMHWVLAEAVNTSACLHRVTGDERWRTSYDAWWAYAERYLVDREHGSWHHELDPANRPAGTVWPGKPDIYHAFQATLIPLLPMAPVLSRGLTPERVATLTGP